MTVAVHSKTMSGPLVSVVICTRNRVEFVAKAVASVLDQDFPETDYEVLVVDNGSTDNTSETIKKFQATKPVCYLLEPHISANVARNTGWRASKGRYVAYLDDDAIALPGWLAAIRDGFQVAPDKIGVLGGRVDPIWGKSRPSWLSDSIAYSLTIVDWGDSEKFITDIDREWLVSANFAVPRELLVLVDGFHPWLDRVGTNLMTSGDTFLQKELMRRGYGCYYRPTMRVQHFISASRIQPEWFLRRYFWQGVSDAVMFLIERSPTPAERLSLAASRSKRLLVQARSLSSLQARPTTADAFTNKCLALVDVGFVAGLLGGTGH
jgi:glycosyltransferase involved in cell wall biosynthesis